MTRPELTYCCRCDGVILPVDTACEGPAGEWMCSICDDLTAGYLSEEERRVRDENADRL